MSPRRWSLTSWNRYDCSDLRLRAAGADHGHLCRPAIASFRPYTEPSHPSMIGAMDITCQNCGESISVTESDGRLSYLTRDATDQEPRSFLITETAANGSSLRHRCELTPESRGAADSVLALDHRVHQASGMISVQAGCSCRSAIAMMQARANGTHQEIDAVIAGVLERRITFG